MSEVDYRLNPRAIDAELERRTERGKRLAEKYSELKGLTFEQFADAMLQEMDIDFVTCCEIYDALNPEAKD